MEKSHSKVVKEIFDAEYEEYDKNVRDTLPHYEEMNHKVIELVDYEQNKAIDILDLGIGSGFTAVGLLEKFPNSKLTGIDLSKKMIQMARNRLSRLSNKVSYVQGNIIDFKPIHKYDVAVAVLSIHHLNREEKKQFFKKMFDALNENGLFIIGDLIIGDTREETEKIEGEWKQYMIDALGAKTADKWMENYKIEDIPDSVNNQLSWLRGEGFREVKCVWKKMNCAVFFGKK